MHIIDLLGDQDQVINETKISSSSIRRKLLGTQLREPELLSKEILSSTHYLIGLTGGIASGKTHISKYLESLDCEVFFCDFFGLFSFFL
jgi:phosphopantetheine adenylyltransferase/dephospho-CoA kinase